MRFLKYSFKKDNDHYIQFQNKFLSNFKDYNDQILKPILRAFFATATRLWKNVLTANESEKEESKLQIIQDKLQQLFETHEIL